LLLHFIIHRKPVITRSCTKNLENRRGAKFLDKLWQSARLAGEAGVISRQELRA